MQIVVHVIHSAATPIDLITAYHYTCHYNCSEYSITALVEKGKLYDYYKTLFLFFMINFYSNLSLYNFL